MIRVDGAAFSTPQEDHVKIEGFCMAEQETSVAEYAACVKASACSEPDRDGGCNWAVPGRSLHPINCIDQEQARRYCEWAGGRLPTIQEWQWLARGELAGTLYPWGDKEPSDQLCWSGQTRRHETCAIVGADKREFRGFVDLTGNVREWTQSKGGDGLFMAAGGSFREDIPTYFDWRGRRYIEQHQRIEEVGVRCAAALGADPYKGGPSAEASAAVPSDVSAPPDLIAPPSSAAPLNPPPSNDSGQCKTGAVLVFGGRFAPAGVAQTITIEALCVDVHEITVDAFAKCVDAHRCIEPDRGGACNWGNASRHDHPINCISADEAQTYCSFVESRLPSVAEAEWIARGGTAANPYPWGSTAPHADLCWSGVSRRRSTCRVGEFASGSTALGIADLLGNVMEWTSTPGTNGDLARITGGSFEDTDAALMGATVFNQEKRSNHEPTAGARCVAEARTSKPAK